MKADTGFAPHVDKNCTHLSLACCKPEIRKTAAEDDWVLGFGGKELSKKSGHDVVGRLIYAARISRVPDFDSYHADREFIGRLDNIYHSKDGKGVEWIQSNNPYHDETRIKRDTKANRVLVSNHFLYFGPSGPRSSALGHDYVKLIKKGPGHKIFDLDKDEEARKFIQYLADFRFNQCTNPTQEMARGDCDECE